VLFLRPGVPRVCAVGTGLIGHAVSPTPGSAVRTLGRRSLALGVCRA
jgi:hypothetical protein